MPNETRYANHMHTRRLPLWVAICVLLVASGCAINGGRPRYETIPNKGGRDSGTSQRLNDEGLSLVEQGDMRNAEQKFRAALDQDIYNAAAHNNLGLILQRTKRYYEAAWEFDYAAKLAPSTSEPRQNLGNLYEYTGRLDDAVVEYEAALEVSPQDIAAMRNLARAYVKTNRRDDSLRSLLERIFKTPGDEQWDSWVRGQLIRIGRKDTDEPPF